jgi:hypothetical protein
MQALNKALAATEGSVSSAVNIAAVPEGRR